MNLYQQALADLHAAANRFGGIHQPAAPMQPMYAQPKCDITVDCLEVTLHPEHLDPRDVHFDRSGFLPDEMTQRAYQILAERHSDELDAIANAIAKGELA